MDKNRKRFWLTPPDLYEKLDSEFHFDFDPCPHPRPDDFNGMKVPWGKSNYINPPFIKAEAFEGVGPTDFARKAIEEQEKGNDSVLILPVRSYITLLLEAGAEARSLGRVRFLEIESKEPWKTPTSIVAFILRGKK